MKWASASASTVYDQAGQGYIDFTSGVILTNVGHGNQIVIEHLRECLDQPLLHCYKHPYEDKLRLEAELLEFAGGGFRKVHFAVTGSEAVETSLRIAFRRGAEDNRSLIVAFDNAFHGKSLGASAISDIPRYRCAPMLGDLGWVLRLPFPTDPTAGRAALAELERSAQQVAAVCLECVQGSSLDKIDRAFLAALRDWCTERRSTLIIDEIQTGFYRLGQHFAYAEYGIVPDIVCLGKGLTSSLPLSALLLNEQTAAYLDDGVDSSTHTANPLSVAAALACLSIYRSDAFLRSFREAEATFRDEMLALRDALAPGLSAPYYGGLFGGIVFDAAAMRRARLADLAEQCAEQGLLVPGPIGNRLNILKLTPPLVIASDEIRRGFRIIHTVLSAASLTR